MSIYYCTSFRFKKLIWVILSRIPQMFPDGFPSLKGNAFMFRWKSVSGKRWVMHLYQLKLLSSNPWGMKRIWDVGVYVNIHCRQKVGDDACFSYKITFFTSQKVGGGDFWAIASLGKCQFIVRSHFVLESLSLTVLSAIEDLTYQKWLYS